MRRVTLGNQAGTTLVELVVVAAIAAVAVVSTVATSLPWLADQTMRGSLHDSFAFAQLAKIAAVSRNRPCRFVIDTDSGALEVWDSLGTDDATDDVLLHEGRIASSVGFERPDSGPVVGLEQIGASNRYQSVFGADGTVTAGTGELCLSGGESFGRVSIHAAGGVEIGVWSSGAWRAES